MQMNLKQDKDVPHMEREIRCLLDDLCVNWGFCIPPKDAEALCARTYLSADSFANALLEAEGMKPEYEKKWVQCISRRFIEHFGADEICESIPLVPKL